MDRDRKGILTFRKLNSGDSGLALLADSNHRTGQLNTQKWRETCFFLIQQTNTEKVVACRSNAETTRESVAGGRKRKASRNTLLTTQPEDVYLLTEPAWKWGACSLCRSRSASERPASPPSRTALCPCRRGGTVATQKYRDTWARLVEQAHRPKQARRPPTFLDGVAAGVKMAFQ